MTTRAILAFIFFAWLLACEPRQADAWRKSSSFASLGGTDGASVPLLVGICESVVAIHGYPCKEFQGIASSLHYNTQSFALIQLMKTGRLSTLKKQGISPTIRSAFMYSRSWDWWIFSEIKL